MKNIIIASTSTVFGSDYLAYLMPDLKVFFKDITQILFVPYARPSGISYSDYTKIAKKAFKNINKTVIGIHEFNDAKKAILNAEAIFVGGGNSFELINKLHQNDLINSITNAVKNGTYYLGTSAGSNICGPTIKTTNDMPIVYPSSFEGLNLIPYNINPHYLDPDPNSKHKGETRETRINEFHVFNNTVVIGLREGSWLRVKDSKITLKGQLTARVFQKNKKPIEIPTATVLSF